MKRMLSAVMVLAGVILSGALTAQTLQNGQFVGPYMYVDSNTSVAPSWSAYRLSASPNFKQSDFEQMPGGPGGQVSCQQIWADWSAFEAGVYQRVNGATVGQCYRAKGWFMSIYKHGQAVDGIQDGSIYQRVGIDPYGGTDPGSPNVIWSWDDPLDRRWRELPVDAIAKSTTITVFAKTRNLYAATNCLSFYDAFSLEPSSPIAISDVRVRPGSNNAIVTWTTDVAATSSVTFDTYHGANKDPDSAGNSTLTTNHSITIPDLVPSTQYFCIVESTAPGKSDTRLGIQVFTTMEGQYCANLGEAKNHPNGAKVFVKNVVVSAGTSQQSMRFYVQEQDRTSGIRVSRGLNLTPYGQGELLDISGTLSTSGGERLLTSATVSKISILPPPRPLALSNRSVGGAQSDPYTPSVPDALGPNNLGLLVSVWGRVTYVNSAAKYCYIDDGSGLQDGNAAGCKGIKVSWYSTLGSFNVLPDSYVLVTGLSSCFQDAGGVHPMIVVRSPQDLIQL